MPFKHNLTKFNILSDSVRKIAKKGKLTENEKRIATMAIIIASFSSAHSWKTSKSIAANRLIDINNTGIKQEYEEAKSVKWKMVSSSDIKEMANQGICDNTFSRWMLSYVDKKEHGNYEEAWARIKERITNSNCD
ncbi:MAG: hypothetical protein M1331_02805 [Candidatus Marsarchaeota archaeon]|nr:hypothetical protein [Candidatus Marsarchaeota archaeon]MCL5106297.1 hypothetical protein [Candidatus Marsarchaeota archaeon]